MKRVSATARIAFGLVSITTCLLLIAALLGFFPNPRNDIRRARTQLCESHATYFSFMVSRTDAATMRESLLAITQHNPDVLSIAIRRDDGSLLIEAGDHEPNWTLTSDDRPTDSQVFVPIFSEGQPWGTVEIRFRPIAGSGRSTLVRPELSHALFLAAVGMVAYYLYLRTVLKQLNPSNVIPNRVREALDTLAEGLLVLDPNERIVLANRAFLHAFQSDHGDLTGTSAQSLRLLSKDDSQPECSPWKEAIESGAAVKGRLFGLKQTGGQELTFSVSAAPIVDEHGKRRGAITSFEDVTRLEAKKRELTTLVGCLRESSDAIKRHNRQLEVLATQDPLTGCLNRRSLFQSFDTEWNSCQRYHHPMSVAMIDIDHFKSINDDHGHSVGDDVLREIGACLSETARQADVVCRYGGEEFAILMPHTDLDDAELAAQRIRIAIEQLRFPRLSVTASIGVSSLSENPKDPQDLLDQADKCLYVAKRNGRNQVVRWDEVPEDWEIDESQINRSMDEVEFAEPVAVPFHAVTALISALAYRDHITAEHSRRVADLCVATAEGLMSLSDCYTLEIAALLHDIGKIGVPDAVLLKRGPLTPQEWEVMRRHDKIGAEIIHASFASPNLTVVVENYRARYGETDPPTGSPSGNSIPLGARILAIADAYDSMVTDRVYRPGRSQREAFGELRRCAGSQFDPELVERFIATIQSYHTGKSELREMSKEAALSIGLQLERLTRALDQQDLAALEAMSRRLHVTALNYGAAEIADKASHLEAILATDRDLLSVIQTANELLDLCRSTQGSFLGTSTYARRTDRDLSPLDRRDPLLLNTN